MKKAISSWPSCKKNVRQWTRIGSEIAQESSEQSVGNVEEFSNILSKMLQHSEGSRKLCYPTRKEWSPVQYKLRGDAVQHLCSYLSCKEWGNNMMKSKCDGWSLGSSSIPFYADLHDDCFSLTEINKLIYQHYRQAPLRSIIRPTALSATCSKRITWESESISRLQSLTNGMNHQQVVNEYLTTFTEPWRRHHEQISFNWGRRLGSNSPFLRIVRSTWSLNNFDMLKIHWNSSRIALKIAISGLFLLLKVTLESLIANIYYLATNGSTWSLYSFDTKNWLEMLEIHRKSPSKNCSSRAISTT